MGSRSRRRPVEPTDEWEQIELLCGRPEQARYELTRPMMLFGVSAAERSRQTGAASEHTLYRQTERSTRRAWRASSPPRWRSLPRWIRRMIVELKGSSA